jgi:hypothetical protein
MTISVSAALNIFTNTERFTVDFVCYDLPMTKNIKDITGRRAGRLTALRPAGLDEKGRYLWLCRCDCGNEKVLPIQSLAPGGNTKSCGCLRAENNRKPRVYKSVNVTHGESSYDKGARTPEYNSWLAMRQRCTDINHSTYVNYGAKGIRVCDRWANSFQAFLTDMGRKPSKGATIDRIDVNGHYEPSNCRWASMNQQQNNKTNNRYAVVHGVRRTAAETARMFSIPERTIHNWINKTAPSEDISVLISKRLSRPRLN